MYVVVLFEVCIIEELQRGLGNPKIEGENFCIHFCKSRKRKKEETTQKFGNETEIEDNIYMFVGRKSEASILRAR